MKAKIEKLVEEITMLENDLYNEVSKLKSFESDGCTCPVSERGEEYDFVNIYNDGTKLCLECGGAVSSQTMD